jgi:hypothetical protein
MSQCQRQVAIVVAWASIVLGLTSDVFDGLAIPIDGDHIPCGQRIYKYRGAFQTAEFVVVPVTMGDLLLPEEEEDSARLVDGLCVVDDILDVGWCKGTLGHSLDGVIGIVQVLEQAALLGAVGRDRRSLSGHLLRTKKANGLAHWGDQTVGCHEDVTLVLWPKTLRVVSDSETGW